MNQIQTFPISKLSLLDRNPRKITKSQFDSLCKSIQDDPDFLQRRPLLVNHFDDKYIVYAGNQRLRAAKKLKWKEIPCIIDESLDENVLKSRILKDNSHHGDWDWDELANSFDIDLLLSSGFTADDLVGLTQDIENIDGEEKTKEEKVKCELCGK